MSGIVEAIIKDHRDIDEAYNNILQATDDDTRTRWQNQFTWELARHSIGEELVVYPAMEKHIAGGKEMADKDRAEHKQVKELLYQFQSMKPSNPQFEPTLKALMQDLQKHIEEEEKQDLPKLQQAISDSQSKSMATSFRRTQKFIPSRSHPSAPDKPPFETVAGLLAAPMDHIQDMFRKFPKEADSELPP